MNNYRTPFNTEMIPRVIAISMVMLACSNSPKGDEPKANQVPALPQIVPIHSFRVLRTFVHDPQAFTQGLVFDHGELFESTGLYGASSLRRVDLESGDLLRLRALPDSLFGEGITIWKNHIVQITWREHTGLVYDRESFDLLKSFEYETEGWGITHDGKRLIMSDGTATLYFIDPKSFSQLGSVIVHDADGQVTLLNELEYIKGEVFANILQSDRIARIDPNSGKVLGWIDLTGILPQDLRTNTTGVLNGIAYDNKEDRVFVTGKNWPQLFEIEIR